MVKTLEVTIKKHILTGFFRGDHLLLWDSIVRESALRCVCPTSCVELRGECSWLYNYKYTCLTNNTDYEVPHPMGPYNGCGTRSPGSHRRNPVSIQG
jgi:hypothetical protein